MKDFLDKIGTYNIFNYLLPGVLFAVFTSRLTGFNLVQEDILEGAFVYYFIGSVVSRIGSLIIEPMLKKIKFISFAPYNDFILASKLDPKIEILSEANNMYRTFCALILCLAVTYCCYIAEQKLPILSEVRPGAIVLGLLILYLFSYKKQTDYINKRVNANKKDNSK